MRRRLLPFISLLIAFACVREEAVDTGVKTFDCFTVTVEDSPMTKVHMEDGGVVKWDNLDRIGVFSDTQGIVPYSKGDDGKFHGETVTGNVFYAIYPYDEALYDPDDPTVLKLGHGGIMLMTAKSEGNNLFFKQACGLLHFRIQTAAEDVFVSLQGNQFEWIGEGQVDLKETNPTFRLSGFGAEGDHSFYQSSRLTRKEGSYWDVYVPMPVGELEAGFDASVSGYRAGVLDYEFKKRTLKSVNLSRGQMYTFTINDVDSFIEAEKEKAGSDREALIAFYNALDGDNWTNNTNWCSDKPLSEWFGVSVNSMGRVEGINLYGNRLKGEFPPELTAMDQLQYLSLGYTNLYEDYESMEIYGSLPEDIGNLTNLRYLSISPSMLTGSFPESMRKLTSLQSLYISAKNDIHTGQSLGYQMSGSLGFLGSLPLLVNIDLSGHQFSGELPDFASSILGNIELDNNLLSGPLPEFSKQKGDMHWIYLQNNRFSGPIPASYASLMDSPTLNQFWFHKNNLSGPIPEEISSHPKFSEYAWMLLADQNPGYGFTIESIPACTHTFETLDGSSLSLPEHYSQADYTMIVRWAEWCNFSRSFIPQVLALKEKYKDTGLQIIWAYGGGEIEARKEYMAEMGLDKVAPHIIEMYDGNNWRPFNAPDGKNHAVWMNWMGYGTPFIEIVDRDGNIVFVDDEEGYYTQLPVANKRSKLEVFLSNLLGGDEYLSTDFSADGTVHTLQTASKGAGINVVLMGDAFSDRLIADGTYEGVMEKAVDAFFSEEPYKTYKDHFNVSYVDVVSKNEVYYGETALNTYYGSGTEVGGDDAKVFKYARKVLSEDEIDDALIIVMINHDNYAGTCYMYSVPDGDYGRGPSISYFPTSSDVTTFNGLVSHEAGGHGFSKLGDEYAYEYKGAISQADVEDAQNKATYGWWKNVDFTGSPTEVKWAKFLNDTRYQYDGLGVFEGAFTYWSGAWRPTQESIMNHNIGGFNAPSREAIWYRIHKLAYGNTWAYNYEDFVTYDAKNRKTSAPTSARSARPNFVEKEFQPLAPPVVVNKNWREVAGRDRK